MLRMFGTAVLLNLSLILIPLPGVCQSGVIPGREEVEALLLERSGLSMRLPDLGYVIEEGAVEGTREAGSLRVTHEKMFYFFIHWGPVEVEEITDAYVRERIPQVWPGEGLRVVSTRPATVAGHPAVYAEVEPSRGFYSARFLIWNCPETGRQFIADMNYNTDLRTPRVELESQVRAVSETFACHEDAPTAPLRTHPVPFHSPGFGIRFSHPGHWYVFESPYAVPHPAYQGVRDRSVGSLLAWPKDRPVTLTFRWERGEPIAAEEEEAGMLGNARQYRKAVQAVSELEGVGAVHPQASESLTVSGHTVLKLLGRVVKDLPDSPPSEGGPEVSEKARVMVIVIEGAGESKDLFISLVVDDYPEDGGFRQVERAVFDRWAADLLEGLVDVGAGL